MRTTWQAELSRHVRAITLTMSMSLLLAGSAMPQMAPQFTASLGASLLWPEAADSAAEVAEIRPDGAAEAAAYPRAGYAGRDEAGVPRYLQRAFSDEERELLREQFGIEEPSRLYLSDTLSSASLTYDSDWDRGERDLVGSYRVGAASVRQPGETWEELERRLAATDPRSFPRTTHRADASLASLDSVVRPQVSRLLSAARRAGFRVRVTEAHRSAERQAYLLTLDGRLTHTATSRHAEGFAVDVVVDDGNLGQSGHARALDRVSPVGGGERARDFPPDRCARPLVGLAPHRVCGRAPGFSLDRGAARDGPLVPGDGCGRLHRGVAPAPCR